MAIARDELNAYVANAATRKAELDALAAENKAMNESAIAELQALDTPKTPTVSYGPSASRDVAYDEDVLGLDRRASEYETFQREQEALEPKWTMINGILSYGGVPFTGEKGWERYQNGVLTETASRDENGNLVWKKAGTTTKTQTQTTESGTDRLLQQLIAQQNAAAAAAAAEKERQRQSIVDVLTARFNQYGLGSLVTKIKELAIDGASEATITLALQDTEEYKMRFKANQTRLAKGLTVLQPAEYLNLEDGYRQVLRSYGLKQFDTDEYVQQFIANDVSATELSNRVVTAVQRVQNADPAILTQLRQYYGIGDNDLVAYVLDPNQQFQKIERQVAAAEIGVAAARQGLTAGVAVSEQLAAQGVTQAEAQKGYATIADILPSAEKLSQIYGATEETYGQGEAEQEVFNQLASAQRKREKLTAREVAAFSGSAGTAKTSLSSPTQGAFQNPDVDLSAPRSVQVREQKPAYPPR